jgi:predicted Zn-dependent protease
MAATLALIDEAIAKGPVQLTIRQGAETKLVVVKPVTACPFDGEVLPSAALGASADGRLISITSALAGFAVSDDELSVLLGHELAHNILKHPQRLKLDDWTGRLASGLGLDAPQILASEREADKVGLFLAARAGYDVSIAPSLWSRLARRYGPSAYVTFTHPGAAERTAAAVATVRKIQRLQAAGEPLIPESLKPGP